MLSIHSDTKSVTKCIEHGACDYMVKPARFEELKLIWKHVVKKSMSETAFEHPSATAALPLGSGDGSSQASGNDHPDQGKGKENELPANVSDEDSSLVKKARVTWSSDLHAVFVRAVNTVGLDSEYKRLFNMAILFQNLENYFFFSGAGPKRILEVMGVPGLSRQNVASHLQVSSNLCCS